VAWKGGISLSGVSDGGSIVGVGITVGGFVGVAVGTGVYVGGIGGTGVEAGVHPLNKTVRNTNARKTDPIDFFMALSPFDLIEQDCA